MGAPLPNALYAYAENVLAGVSHLLNALTGGDARNSFSARAGAEAVKGRAWAKVASAIIDRLLFSRNHCIEHAREEGLI